MNNNLNPKKRFISTRNACKLCAPLGAAIVFRGIKSAMPFLHGSQGCATYIRRYIISHFREPMDIASSSFSEETAVFGGKKNLMAGLQNLYLQYKPGLIGIATTCLAETIGEDVDMILRELKNSEFVLQNVKLVFVSTPSYKGTHIDGFLSAEKSVVESLVGPLHETRKQINIFPRFLSNEDLRHLKEILGDFNFPYIMLPDYSETLDSGIWTEYHNIPEGGTPIGQIVSMGNSLASIEFASAPVNEKTAGDFLSDNFAVPCFKMGIPVGIKNTDVFFDTLKNITGFSTPKKYLSQRARLVDAYVDGHKYLFGKKAIVYGEKNLTAAIISFLTEIGVIPVLSDSCDDTDFMTIKENAEKLNPDFIIGNSKGYFISRLLGIPLVRIGFPIHDRIGGNRILHIGYRGTQQLFDQIVNTLLCKKQEDSDVGYSYL